MVTINEMKNLALFTIGEPDEIDFTNTTLPLVQKVNRIYDTSKDFVLSNYFWRFAEKRVELTNPIQVTDTFTADSGTDFITTSATTMSNGLEVELSTTGTLPAGLSTDTTYYTISSTGLTSQLSTTLGGTEVDITDTGTGTHTVTFMAVYNSPYKYLFIKPTDTLVMRKAYIDTEWQQPIQRFEFNNSGLHVDDLLSTNSSVRFWYIADTDESLFPNYFVDYFKYKLALDLTFNLTGDTDLIQLLAAQERQMLLSAKNIDAKQVRTKSVRTAPFIQIRN
ncbi:MAG: hypothetical protein GY861_15950 [bacterium]|nr:hypothetical protein [bacterium]